VLPVIFFHAGVSAFSGGYVGVDVFFVISGYLITSIILNELQSDAGFSIARFYERRARRILPALYAVMIPSTIAAWLLLVPDQLENYGQSLVATTLFANNLLLAFTTGYWDVLTELKPLVHTWSLSVEEQFYVVFPLLMMALWRNSRIVLILLGLAILSLASADFGANFFGSGHFYLPHSRAWELLAGSLCAYALNRADPVRNDFLALLGLLMIGYAVFTFTAETPFPSSWGLFPVIGTALIILYATGDSIVGRLLSWRPMVMVGLISYSAYLWHQPIFSFARSYLKERPDAPTLSLLIPVSLLLAYLSWRYVEAPFRDKRRVSVKALVAIFLPLTTAFVGVGLWLHVAHGAPHRLAATVVDGGRTADYNPTAFRFKKDAFTTQKPVRLLVVGDSYGRDVVNMVVETFGTDRIEIVYRDDIPCAVASPLMSQSTAVFVSFRRPFDADCVSKTLNRAGEKPVFYFGSKTFGTNINWVMQEEDRTLLLNRPDEEDMALTRENAAIVPARNFVPVMERIMIGDMVPFTNKQGDLLSDDTRHLTKAGAAYVGARVLADDRLRQALKR